MAVHLGVSLTGNGQVKIAVAGEEFQHVIQKTHAGGNLGLSGPIQIQREGDLGFPGISFD